MASPLTKDDLPDITEEERSAFLKAVSNTLMPDGAVELTGVERGHAVTALNKFITAFSR